MYMCTKILLKERFLVCFVKAIVLGEKPTLYTVVSFTTCCWCYGVPSREGKV